MMSEAVEAGMKAAADKGEHDIEKDCKDLGLRVTAMESLGARIICLESRPSCGGNSRHHA